MSLSHEPWENGDGSTNVPAFLAAYKADDNVFWATGIGHIQNVLDDRIDALDEAEATITGLREALRGMVECGGCGHPRHIPNDECWWQDRSECAYAQGRGPCSFGCTTEPSCMTDTPREGWPLANAQAALARPEFPDTERG